MKGGSTTHIPLRLITHVSGTRSCPYPSLLGSATARSCSLGGCSGAATPARVGCGSQQARAAYCSHQSESQGDEPAPGTSSFPCSTCPIYTDVEASSYLTRGALAPHHSRSAACFPLALSRYHWPTPTHTFMGQLRGLPGPCPRTLRMWRYALYIVARTIIACL